MKAESMRTSQPPAVITEIIEAGFAELMDVPDDGWFHARALVIAEKFWQAFDVNAVAEAIANSTSVEEQGIRVEKNPDALQEVLPKGSVDDSN
jgi:hypothetical protein